MTTPSNRWLILASPQGHLTARQADYFRSHPASHQAKWQCLLSLRLPRGIHFQQVRERVYSWAITAYGL
jgi:hypothetical protein